MENIGRKSGWKTVFSTVWQRVKNTEDEKPGRKFSLPSPQISSPKSGGKLWREKCSHNQIMEMPSLSQRSQQLSKEEEDNFPTTNSAQPNYHHRNPKITQKQLKMNSNPIRKPIPNPTQNQLKINPSSSFSSSSSSSPFLVAFEL